MLVRKFVGPLPDRALDNKNDNLLRATYNNGGPGYAQFLTFTQSYGYDHVNRLNSVADTGYSRTFCSDAYGNTWVTGYTTIIPAGNTPQMINGACPSSNTPYDANNRINGGSYDPAGNQFVVNGNTLAYDAENRLVSETDGVTHEVETYGYDGDGRRVSKTSPSGTTYYVRDALGQLAAEYSTTNSSFPCGTCYLSVDHLGSTRLVTDSAAKVIGRHDYLPFGEEIDANTAGRDSPWGPGNDTVNQKFTGKERDQETGLDYFGARYLSGALGRFGSADPENAGADPSDPQTWNAYSYVVNQPLNLTDPDGRDAQGDDPCRGRPKPCSGTTVRAKVDELAVVPIITVAEFGQQSRQLVQGILDWAAQPRNSTCLAASTAGGASVGSQVGLLGFAGGPTGLATEPAGFAIGGGIGWAGGMVACMSGTGGGTSSANSDPTGNRAESKKFWKGLKPFRGKTKTNGVSGKSRRFYEWDHTHNDVEVYDSRGNHLGSADPDTGNITKPAVPGRRIDI